MKPRSCRVHPFAANHARPALRPCSSYSSILHPDRKELLSEAMLTEGLTVDRIVRTVSRPQGFQLLFQAFHLSTFDIRCGERLDLVNSAWERSVRSSDHEVREGISHTQAHVVAQTGEGAHASEYHGESP